MSSTITPQGKGAAMLPEERTETARLTGRVLRGLTGVVRDAHGSIAARSFGATRRRLGPLGPWVTPVEIAHDTLALGVYSLTGHALELTARGVGRVADRLSPAPAGAGSVADLRRVPGYLALVHGLHGDKLLAAGSAIAFPMTVRRSGREVALTRQGLADAYPDATGTLVVFVHGFVGTEQMWKRRADRDGGGRRLSYGRRLEVAGLGSAVWVRYNTGLRVSSNGRDLRDLLRRLHARWPVPVERIVLVGHSMGGLVAHSALAQADLDEPWTEVTSDTITLGTPHHGTPLERAANSVAAELAPHPSTRWVADLVRHRSDGIRDMRHGNLVAADWHEHDPEDPLDHRTDARPHESVRHLAVVATLARDPGSRLGGLLGDLVVGRESARGWADPAEGAVGSSRTVRLGGLTHQDLLGHPRVYALLTEVLAAPFVPAGTPFAPGGDEVGGPCAKSPPVAHDPPT